jgi:hypothetical protein
MTGGQNVLVSGAKISLSKRKSGLSISNTISESGIDGAENILQGHCFNISGHSPYGERLTLVSGILHNDSTQATFARTTVTLERSDLTRVPGFYNVSANLLSFSLPTPILIDLIIDYDAAGVGSPWVLRGSGTNGLAAYYKYSGGSSEDDFVEISLRFDGGRDFRIIEKLQGNNFNKEEIFNSFTGRAAEDDEFFFPFKINKPTEDKKTIVIKLLVVSR